MAGHRSTVFNFQALDCQYDFYNPEDMLWGTVKNGTSHGMFKDIVDKKVDLAIGGIWGIIERHRVATFFPIVSTLSPTITFAAPLSTSRYLITT